MPRASVRLIDSPSLRGYAPYRTCLSGPVRNFDDVFYADIASGTESVARRPKRRARSFRVYFHANGFARSW